MTWEYIAGFFDGEGSITYNGKGHRISIAQTNKKVLGDVARFTKIGYVISVTKRRSHWKDSWVYYIAKQSDILSFLEHTQQFLIVKRHLAHRVIKKLIININRAKKRRDLRLYRITQAKKLRLQGLTFRAIGKILNIDFGFARQLTLIK